MATHGFSQLDVFTARPMLGNPLAVVHDADDLDGATMQRVANWTNLSETTFLLPPDDGADYGLRIFTPTRELPFAGHPTLGSCQAWLDAGGQPANETILQYCAAGLIPIRRDGTRLAFRAPPLIRSGPIADELRLRLPDCLGIPAQAIAKTAWIDNGPGWIGVLLRDVADLRAIRPHYPAFAGMKLGVIAPASDQDYDIELRAFTGAYEDPVTGSLNASAAQWLFALGLVRSDYVAAQGMALGRAGRVHVAKEGNDIWVGGQVLSCVRGQITL